MPVREEQDHLRHGPLTGRRFQFRKDVIASKSRLRRYGRKYCTMASVHLKKAGMMLGGGGKIGEACTF